MSKPYTPRPGSLTERVLNALPRLGGSMTAQQIAEEFSTKSNAIFNLLAPAVKAGMLAKATNEEGRTVYSLPDLGTAESFAPKARKATKKKQRVPTAEAATAQPEADEAPPPHCRPVRRWRHRAVWRHPQRGRQRLHPERGPGTPRAPLPGAGVRPH